MPYTARVHPAAPRLALLGIAALLATLAVACGGEARAAAPVIAASPLVELTPSAARGTSLEGFTSPDEPPAEASAPPAPQVQPPPRTPLVVLDPGHAADEVGAAANGVVEKTSNLDMALRVAAVLREQGVRTLLTRTADGRAFSASPMPIGYNATRMDLQARIDIANAVAAAAFVSIHSNGIADPSVRGVEAYYNSSRPFATDNRVLATLVLDGVIAELRAAGYPATRRDVIDDACLKMFQGRCFPLFVLGPERVTDRDEVYRRGGDPQTLGFGSSNAITSRSTQMPGTLVELLFVTSPADAAWLRDDAARDAMARGLARGVTDFLAQSRGRG